MDFFINYIGIITPIFVIALIMIFMPAVRSSIRQLLGPVSGQYGQYRANGNYRIAGRIPDFQMDNNAIDYQTCPMKSSASRYRVDRFRFINSQGRFWEIKEADVSIEYMRIYWSERGRTLKGQSPQYAFSQLCIDFNPMNKQALINHINDIAKVWDFDYDLFMKWLNEEVEMYERPDSFDINIPYGDDGRRSFRLRIHYVVVDTHPKTSFNLLITI